MDESPTKSNNTALVFCFPLLHRDNITIFKEIHVWIHFTKSKSFTARFNVTLMGSNVHLSLLEKAVDGARKGKILLYFFSDCGESSVKSCLSGQNLTAVRNEERIFSIDWTSSRAGAEKHILYVLHLIQGRDFNLLLFLSGCGCQSSKSQL